MFVDFNIWSSPFIAWGSHINNIVAPCRLYVLCVVSPQLLLNKCFKKTLHYTTMSKYADDTWLKLENKCGVLTLLRKNYFKMVYLKNVN